MFVTDELREAVDLRLRTVDERSSFLTAALNWNDVDWQDVTRIWAAERALHVAIECVTDAANLIIDALVMREPGSYADIVRVIAEEGVVDRTFPEQFSDALTFRNQLVREYYQLKPADVARAVQTCAPLFAAFVRSVRDYLGISSR